LFLQFQKLHLSLNLIYSQKLNVLLAKVFNPPMIVFSNNITKSLRDTLSKMGKTVLLFEGGKSKELNPNLRFL
jgi:alcohol dehydrogenase YqhD (iron-dependent ADH family)